MLSKNPSFNRQLLYSFLFHSFIFTVAAVISLFLLNEVKKIRIVTLKILDIRHLNSQLLEKELQFILKAPNDENYHANHQSRLLKERQTALYKIRQMMEDIPPSLLEICKLTDTYQQLQRMIQQHNELFLKLEGKLKTRGFKDYGLEGKMRAYAHSLENKARVILPQDILTLRRHEKDFILRGNEEYVKKFNALILQIGAKLMSYKGKYDKELATLRNYQLAFNQLVSLTREIGSIESPGLIQSLVYSKENIVKKTEYFTLSVTGTEKTLVGRIHLSFYLTALISIIISLVASYVFAIRRSAHLTLISNQIKEIIKYNKAPDLQINLRNAPIEVVNLTMSFKMLLYKLDRQIEIVKEKSNILKKKNTRLKKVNQELDKFVYSVSHDLRAPLSSIMGLIIISKEESDLQILRHYINLMDQSVKKLDGFIKDIIDLSKNARTGLVISKIDFEPMIREVIEQYNYLDLSQKVEKRLVIHQNSEFYSDQNRIRILLSNLISNAIRYANPGKNPPYLEVYVETDEQKATLLVKDNGIGIKEEFLTKIFDMFFRASENSKGSGLGLYIVKETLAKLKGTIKVDSQAGEGTKFSIDIPNQKQELQRQKEVQLPDYEEGMLTV